MYTQMNEWVNEWMNELLVHCGPTFNTHPVENRLPKTIRNLRLVRSHSPALQGHGNHVCVLDVLLWILAIHRGIQHVAFYAWLLSLKMYGPGASMLIPVWKLMAEWYSIIPIGHIWFICSSWMYIFTVCLLWLLIQSSWVVQACLTLATLWTAACQASLFIINSQSLFIVMSIELVMSSNHLILWHPHLLPTSVFPSFSQSFTQLVSSLHQMVKVLEFQFQY